MAKSWSMSVIYCFLVILHFHYMFSAKCQAENPPALYVFGDSFVDNGNIEFHETIWNATYSPYAIDFWAEGYYIPGRFTNDITVADFFGYSLDLQMGSPFMTSSEWGKNIFTSGFNYAYGPAGILKRTGIIFGQNVCLEEQINLFNTTVQEYLAKNFKSAGELSQYLSQSIFLVHIGTHDYINDYLFEDYYKRFYNPEQYAELLVNELGNQLKASYNLGARKIVVFEIPALGCFPRIVNSDKPKTRCSVDINDMVATYNRKLAAKLKDLSSTLNGLSFSIAKTFNFTLAMVENPKQYGLIDSRNPCCPPRKTDGTGLCEPNGPPCQDRNSTLFYDSIHLTTAAYGIIAEECFEGQDLCSPNLKSLAME